MIINFRKIGEYTKPNTDPILFQKIEEREKNILERFNKLSIDDETLEITDLEF